MRIGLTVFFIVNIFLIYGDLFNKKYLKKIIGVYLVNTIIITLIFYIFTSFFNLEISMFEMIISIIFSAIYSFMREDEGDKHPEISLKATVGFAIIYVVLALISYIILYFKGANYIYIIG